MLKILLSLVLFSSFYLEAAFPVTHVYITRIFFKYYPKYTLEEQQAFIVGTLFPDIRHLADSDRSETHFDPMPLSEVLKEENPFIAGMKFHSYVDIERDKLVDELRIYEELKKYVPPSQNHTFLKLVEDEIVATEGSYGDVSVAMATIYPEEIRWGFKEKTLKKWHQAVSFLFMTSPSQALSLACLSGKGFMDLSYEDIQNWNKLLKPASKDEALVEWIHRMGEHFEELMKPDGTALSDL